MSDTIRSVERALDVLMCFTDQTPALSMTQISELVGINKSTIHRILATLERKRFVERDSGTGIYRPGIRLLQYAFLSLEHNDLRRLASPFLHNLCNQYQENVNLTILDDTYVVYLDVVESPQRVKLAAVPGQRLPAFCTASGKAILAFLPEDQLKRILERGMPRYTQNTISSREAFFEEMLRSRESGFAVSVQEFEEGINAVAAPIITTNGKVIASISIAGPAYRLTRERMNLIGPDLASQINEFSHEIGLAVHVE